VIAIVGMNPKKKYLVSPEERAALLRVMLQGNPDTAGVSVEGRSLHQNDAMS
jgi:phosphopantetheine adenylyltransferase